MLRRKFIALLGGAAAAWTGAAYAQQLPVIGFLGSTTAAQFSPFVEAFSRGLREAGYVERETVTIAYRWAEGRYHQLPALAAELVRDRVDVIVAVAPPAALAAKVATSTIPIVFSSGGDPVALGLVSSINRPGGNLTGATFVSAAMSPKLMELILQLVPNATSVALLVNPDNQNSAVQVKDLQSAGRTVGREVHVLHANSNAGLEAAFQSLVERKTSALVVGTDVFFLSRKELLNALAQRHGLPTVYNLREYPLSGGLLSYGPSLAEQYRQIGLYVGRILKGAKPADLPVLQPTKFELVLNLKAAHALGISFPPTLLALADEVIE